MKLQKLFQKCTFLILLSVSFLFSAAQGRYAFAQAHNVTPLDDRQLEQKILDTYFNYSVYSLNANGVTYNTDVMEKVTFENTDVEAVLIKEVNFAPNSRTNHVVAIYTKNSLVSDMYMEYTITESRGEMTATIYDADDDRICGITTRADGSMAFTLEPSWAAPTVDPNSRKSWGKRWAECVGSGLASMTDPNNPGGILMGLACMAAGWVCAVGAGVGCAAAATFV